MCSRRRNPEPGPMQIQVSPPENGTEVCINSAPSDSDIDLPIAIRKGTRKCTKCPLYPLAQYTSFQNFPNQIKVS